MRGKGKKMKKGGGEERGKVASWLFDARASNINVISHT